MGSVSGVILENIAIATVGAVAVLVVVRMLRGSRRLGFR
jgi:uncharacterized membrane protein YeaQ/YmgE (transglycosylase-associated protein family)